MTSTTLRIVDVVKLTIDNVDSLARAYFKNSPIKSSEMESNLPNWNYFSASHKFSITLQVVRRNFYEIANLLRMSFK